MGAGIARLAHTGWPPVSTIRLVEWSERRGSHDSQGFRRDPASAASGRPRGVHGARDRRRPGRTDRLRGMVAQWLKEGVFEEGRPGRRSEPGIVVETSIDSL